MYSEKVTLCTRRFYRSSQIPEENGLLIMKAHMVLREPFSGGALMLTTMDGEDFSRPVNLDAVKKYFA